MLNKSVVTFATHNTQIHCGCNCQLNAILLLQGKASPIKTIEIKAVQFNLPGLTSWQLT